jgi:hypothetical protein
MAMNKQRRTSNISNIFSYDDAGNIVIKDYSQVIRYNWNGTLHAFVGGASISSIPAATTDTDKFLVSDGGVLKYRTGSELLSDIGAQPSGSYVPAARTLTINGTTYDLSANRSWTIGGGISGSGTTNYIPKWTSSTALGNSIIDDDGTSASVNCTTGGGLNIKYNTAIKLVLTGGTGFGSVDIPVGLDFKIRPDSAEGITVFSNGNTFIGTTPINAGFRVDIGGTVRASTVSTNNIGVFSGVEPNINIVALGASNSAALFLSPSAGFNGGIHNRTGGGLEFYTGATPTLSATITATNNLLVGTGVDEGYRAQVYGTMYTKTAGFISNLDSTINHALYATGQLLTSAASNGMIYLDTTWNTTGNPSAIYLNVTNTASGAFAKLLDLRVGISAMFQVDKAGGILTGQPTGGTQGVWKLGQYNATAPSATGYVEVEINGVLYKLLAST